MKKSMKNNLLELLLVVTLTFPNISLNKKENLKELATKIGCSQISAKTNYNTSDFSQDSEKVLLARMLLGEVEDCSKQEIIAVAYTAINRINDNKKWNGENLKEVILKPYQYSCFNEAFNKKLKNPLNYNKKEFLRCLKLSEEILSGKYKDPTNGATHYYNPSTVKEPFWAKKTEKIGKIKNSRHLFYKEL